MKGERNDDERGEDVEIRVEVYAVWVEGINCFIIVRLIYLVILKFNVTI